MSVAPDHLKLSAKVCVFDVNETCLDYLAGLGPVMHSIFGRQGAYEEFFRQLILLTHVLTATGSYKDFATLVPVALAQVAENEGVDGNKRELPADALDKVKAAMGKIVAHKDVSEGLDKLRAQGWKLYAFSNSNQAAVDGQLKQAGLYSKFDGVLSVDAVQKFKPVPECYHYALKQAGVKAKEAVHVAAHDWDLEGAKAVGMNTAFVKRHLGFASAYHPPDLSVPDFVALADALGQAAK
eukprot:1175817-Prorocentrum_minimum.AAC.7